MTRSYVQGKRRLPYVERQQEVNTREGRILTLPPVGKKTGVPVVVSRRAPREADWLKTFGGSPAREISLAAHVVVFVFVAR